MTLTNGRKRRQVLSDNFEGLREEEWREQRKSETPYRVGEDLFHIKEKRKQKSPGNQIK